MGSRMGGPGSRMRGSRMMKGLNIDALQGLDSHECQSICFRNLSTAAPKLKEKEVEDDCYCICSNINILSGCGYLDLTKRIRTELHCSTNLDDCLQNCDGEHTRQPNSKGRRSKKKKPPPRPKRNPKGPPPKHYQEDTTISQSEESCRCICREIHIEGQYTICNMQKQSF